MAIKRNGYQINAENKFKTESKLVVKKITGEGDKPKTLATKKCQNTEATRNNIIVN